MSWLRRVLARLNGLARLGDLARLNGRVPLPEGFSGTLEPDEWALASARSSAGPLVATNLGLWVPEHETTTRRIGWHSLSKATWKDEVLSLVESEEEQWSIGDAVLLRDRPVRRLAMEAAGTLPETVRAQITSSIHSTHYRSLPGGGARFVQRKVPGRDGVVLQVRPDDGTDEAVLAEFVRSVAEQLRHTRESDS